MTLESYSHWVLKMVQAAVAAGCSHLEFRIGRNIVQVDFHGASLDLVPLRDGLLDPSYSGEQAYQEMFIGLRTLLFENEFRIRALEGSWLAWDGESWLDSISGESTTQHLTLIVGNKPTFRSRRALEYTSALRERALYAPLELFLDGMKVNPHRELAAKLPEFGVDYPTHTAPLLYAHFDKDDVLHDSDLVKCKGGFFKDALRSLDYFLSGRRGQRNSRKRCHLHIEANYRDRKRDQTLISRELQPNVFSYLFTRLGVVCRVESHTFKVGGAFQVPLDDGRTDLSGLSLERPSKDRMAIPAPYLERLYKEIRSHRSMLHLYQPDIGRWGAGFVMAGGMAAVLSTAFGGGALLAIKLGSSLGTVGGTTMLSFGLDTREQKRELARQVDRLKRGLSAIRK